MPVHSQPAAEGNTYNQNFRNRFCGCGDLYDAHQEKGTMFQCLGLATESDRGCGEDWWHPECITGIGRGWTQKINANRQAAEAEDPDENPLPPGFPDEDDFETFICYKCVDAHPWIKRYAKSEGFLEPVHRQKQDRDEEVKTETPNNNQGKDEVKAAVNGDAPSSSEQPTPEDPATSKKRKGPEDQDENSSSSSDPKKAKIAPSAPADSCKYSSLPPAPLGQLSLFLREDFRDHLCRCSNCYPDLSKHPQLLEEEESYEPPLSEDGDEGNQSADTGSLYDRGEAALNNVDRVRAIGKALSPPVHPSP